MLDETCLLELLLRRGREGKLAAGWDGIRWVLEQRLEEATASGRPAFLLFGVFHDAGGQVQAFGRLTGPLGIGGLSCTVAEQLDASGRWEGIAAPGQAGDSENLRAFQRNGDPAALSRIQARQEKLDYTAWKYGYLSEVMDLVLRARAGGTPLLGCDMPRRLQARLAGSPPELVLRLRELHCALAFGDACAPPPDGSPRLVAMLWGQDHLAPSALPRFLPANALVLRVLLFGHRPGPQGLERGLRKSLRLADPLLAPIDEAAGRFALLLPGDDLAATVDRSREWLPDVEEPRRSDAARETGGTIEGVGGGGELARLRLRLRSAGGGRLLLGGEELRLGAGPLHRVRRVAGPAAAGEVAYLLVGPGGRHLAGALPAGAPGELELELDAMSWHVTLLLKLRPLSGARSRFPPAVD